MKSCHDQLIPKQTEFEFKLVKKLLEFRNLEEKFKNIHNMISWKYVVAAILKANQDLLANKYQVLCFCTEKQKIIDHIFQWMLSRIPGNCNIESNQDLSKYQVLGFRDTKQQQIFYYVFQVVDSVNIWGHRSALLLRGLSQITFALRVGRWSEKSVVYYIKSAN